MDDAALRADERIARVRNDSAGRYQLARAFYRHAAGPRHRYGAAELSFIRWSIDRDVLEPESGSPWWREVNTRLLRDKVEAELLSAGVTGLPTAHSVELWLGFIHTPTPTSWYRAHNSSVVVAYLEHEPLTAAELPVERFMMNVALIRVLYTHALLARPRLALGPLAPLGPLVATRGVVSSGCSSTCATPSRPSTRRPPRSRRRSPSSRYLPGRWTTG